MHLEKNLLFVYNQKIVVLHFEHYYDYFHCNFSVVLFHYIINFINEFIVNLWNLNYFLLYIFYISSNKFINRS